LLLFCLICVIEDIFFKIPYFVKIFSAYVIANSRKKVTRTSLDFYDLFQSVAGNDTKIQNYLD